MSVNDRMRSHRLRAGMTQAQVAKAVGVTRAAVQQWERLGGTAPRRALQSKVADVFGLPVERLMSEPNTFESPHQVPLLSAAEVHQIPDLDHFSPPPDAPMVRVNLEVGTDTFAVTVHGDSMVDDYEAFPDGAVLIVDRNLLAEPNDYVVVQDGPDQILFRQLVKDDGEYLLKPLNPRYPVKPLGTGEVIGVVREFTKKIR